MNTHIKLNIVSTVLITMTICCLFLLSISDSYNNLFVLYLWDHATKFPIGFILIFAISFALSIISIHKKNSIWGIALLVVSAICLLPFSFILLKRLVFLVFMSGMDMPR